MFKNDSLYKHSDKCLYNKFEMIYYRGISTAYFEGREKVKECI